MRPDGNVGCVNNSTKKIVFFDRVSNNRAACGDGSTWGSEECDGGFGCQSDCTCGSGWKAQAAPSSSCQLRTVILI